MKIEIHHRPVYAVAAVALDIGETVVAEGGAMISMDSHIQMETSAGKKDDGMMKGLLKGLKRMVAGESFFQNRFTAASSPGEVLLAPTHCGDIAIHNLKNGGLMIQSSSYLFSSTGVDIDAKWGGAKSFFGGEGLIMLKASGQGQIGFNAFGGIKEIDVSGEMVVDTGHIVAFEDSLDFTVRKFGGGFIASFLSGEGLVCLFKGTGKLWIQTRNPAEFGSSVAAKLPPRRQ